MPLRRISPALRVSIPFIVGALGAACSGTSPAPAPSEAVGVASEELTTSAEAPVAPADFDGDGIADVCLRTKLGRWQIDYAKNGFGKWDAVYVGSGPAPGIPVPADYDGDHLADLALRQLDGHWRIDYAKNGFTGWDVDATGFGSAVDFVPAPADYDGDGKTDLASKDVWGGWHIDHAIDGFGGWNVNFGGYGAGVPVPADYDGDGKADLAVRSDDGYWRIDYAKNGFGQWDAPFPGYGAPADFIPAPADYDGDSRADFASKDVWGVWHVDYAKNGFGAWDATFGSYSKANYGSGPPRPADYDGDAKADLAVVTPDGLWRVAFAKSNYHTWDATVGLGLWQPNQSFGDANTWLPTNLHLYSVADINGDRKSDFVGLAADGVWSALSTGSSFAAPRNFPYFQTGSGWGLVLFGDVTGDGADDLVGFGTDAVWVSPSTRLSTGPGFVPPIKVVPDFGSSEGWQVGTYDRLLADVDGDGRKDIVGFGYAGVWTALSGPGGFGPATFVLAAYGLGALKDFRGSPRHVMVDLDADGRADIVAISDDGVWTSLSTGSAFTPPAQVFTDSGFQWRDYTLADVNGDGYKDLVAEDDEWPFTLWTALGTGRGTFDTATPVGKRTPGADDFYGPLETADVNGDGYEDVVSHHIWVAEALGSPGGLRAFGAALCRTPPFPKGGIPLGRLGDFNGDGSTDFLGLAVTGSTEFAAPVTVALSTHKPPPPPPAAPSNLRLTAAGNNTSISWTDNSNNETAFVVENRTTGEVLRPAANTTSVIWPVSLGSGYCFRVEALADYGPSAPTAEVCSTPSH